MYEFCLQILYIVLMMWTYCRSRFMYKKCMQDVYKMYPTFRQTFAYILYKKLSYHSSFCIIYIMYTKVCWNVRHILYIYIVYILYKLIIYILHNFCIQNTYMISVHGCHGKNFRFNFLVFSTFKKCFNSHPIFFF